MTDPSKPAPDQPDRPKRPNAKAKGQAKPKPKARPKAKPRPEAASKSSDKPRSKAKPAAKAPAESTGKPVEKTPEQNTIEATAKPSTADSAKPDFDKPDLQKPVGSEGIAVPDGDFTAPAEPIADVGAVMGDQAAVTEEAAGSGSYLLFTALPSWLTSTIVHVIVLLALALLTLPPITRPNRENELVLGESDDSIESLEQFQDQAIDSVEISDAGEVSEMLVEDPLITDEPLITTAMDMSAAAVKLDLDPLSSVTANSGNVDSDMGAMAGDALSGRGKAAKARMIREAGGTQGSEKAVAGALQWLANHQMPDGGWDINHKRHPKCNGQCSDAGNMKNCRLGATGLALLPFLGAGKTHLDGPDQEIVRAGLQFLLKNIKYQGKRGALLDEGTYYSHGICAIVLCEAYAMTKDKTLRDPAQALLNETCFAQDPIGGGWRYNRHQPGDTSALGWQLMALKSGHMGYLQVPGQTVSNASRFLDSVQENDGANYGYTDPGKIRRGGLTAVGLLCRMYLGWEKDHPAMEAGVEYLAKRGPDVGSGEREDMYYNYYATQVLRHYGGPKWEKWNEKMREFLVNEQETKGHRSGSWSFKTGHSSEKGGRLFNTALGAMILEVYYRHLPLYKDQAAEDEFQL